MRRATTTLLVIGVGLPPVLITAAPWIMGTVFAEVEPAAALVLAGLSLALPWRFVGYLLGTALTSGDRMDRRVMAAAAALGVVVVVDVIGIGLVGILAPVIGSILAAVVLVGLYAVQVRERFGPVGLRSGVTLTAVVAALLATAIGLGVRTIVPEPIAAIVAGLVYVGVIAVRPGWAFVLGGTRPAVAPR